MGARRRVELVQLPLVGGSEPEPAAVLAELVRLALPGVSAFRCGQALGRSLLLAGLLT